MGHTVNALTLVGSSGLITVNGNDMDSSMSNSAVIVIDITTITGTAPTATFKFQGKDTVSGKYYDMLTSAALAAAATTVIRVSPYGLTAGANVFALDFVPPVWRITCTQGGTAVTNLTCTVGVQLVE
jgi:hypothetical protein